uniref:Uncharacterized protein n=1 Tax=Schizaphis graminum TaxID=13262 RepID=A0A2S2NPY9_SCHGA
MCLWCDLHSKIIITRPKRYIPPLLPDSQSNFSRRDGVVHILHVVRDTSRTYILQFTLLLLFIIIKYYTTTTMEKNKINQLGTEIYVYVVYVYKKNTFKKKKKCFVFSFYFVPPCPSR